MEFRILGPIEVLDEGRAIALQGSRMRALLALLLITSAGPLRLHKLAAAALEQLNDERPGPHKLAPRAREGPRPGAVPPCAARVARAA
jgi:hypothetical protein